MDLHFYHCHRDYIIDFAKILLPTWVLKQEHFQVAIINVGFIFLATKLKSIHYKKRQNGGKHLYGIYAADCNMYHQNRRILRTGNFELLYSAFVCSDAGSVRIEPFSNLFDDDTRRGGIHHCTFYGERFCTYFRRYFLFVSRSLFGMLVTAIILRLRCKDNYDKLTYRRLSMTDSLTGVLNKSTALTQIGRYLLTRIDNTHCALLIIDLDNFKKVNDKYGHQVGDRLLNQVGEILHEAFRGNDIVGRFGGDEFVVLMKNVFDDEIIERKCEEILKLLESLTLDEENFKISCSMGAVIAKKEE